MTKSNAALAENSRSTKSPFPYNSFNVHLDVVKLGRIGNLFYNLLILILLKPFYESLTKLLIVVVHQFFCLFEILNIISRIIC